MPLLAGDSGLVLALELAYWGGAGHIEALRLVAAQRE
jgi:hypothetical protein